MTRAKPYVSWCPRRDVCVRENCGHCPETRTEWFKSRLAEHNKRMENLERARKASIIKNAQRRKLQEQIKAAEAGTATNVTGIYRKDYPSHKAYISAKNKAYRERSAENAFHRSIMEDERQWMQAQSPTLYADNIGPKTDKADIADPIPGWIYKHRSGYSMENAYKSIMGNYREW